MIESDDTYHVAIDTMAREDGLDKLLAIPGVWDALCAHYDNAEIDREMVTIAQIERETADLSDD